MNWKTSPVAILAQAHEPCACEMVATVALLSGSRHAVKPRSFGCRCCGEQILLFLVVTVCLTVVLGGFRPVPEAEFVPIVLAVPTVWKLTTRGNLPSGRLEEEKAETAWLSSVAAGPQVGLASQHHGSSVGGIGFLHEC